MPSHEIGAMLEVRRHGFRSAALDAQILRCVVATVAVGLRVAGLTQALLLHGFGSVVLHEVAFMAQKGSGKRAFYVRERMTRRALPEIPLRFMLVAAEALLHRRQARSTRLDDARMTRDA